MVFHDHVDLSDLWPHPLVTAFLKCPPTPPPPCPMGAPDLSVEPRRTGASGVLPLLAGVVAGPPVALGEGPDGVDAARAEEGTGTANGRRRVRTPRSPPAGDTVTRGPGVRREVGRVVVREGGVPLPAHRPHGSPVPPPRPLDDRTLFPPPPHPEGSYSEAGDESSRCGTSSSGRKGSP